MRVRLACVVVLYAGVAAAQETVAVRGRVVADDTGAPVAGARVSLGGLPVHVRTDAAGLFEIRVPSPGPPLAVDRPGYARVMVPRAASAAGDVSVRLVRAAALTVHVFDQQGEPVVGANIRISCANGTSVGPSNDLGERRDGHLQPGRCGVNVGNVGAWVRIAGEPTIDQLAKAFEQLRARAPTATNEAKIEEIVVDLRAGEEAAIAALDASPPARPTVTVLGEARRLPPGTSGVRGRILGPGRRPVEGATVTLSSSEGAQTTISGPSGDYAFDNLPAGRFRVRATRPGLVSREYGQQAAGTIGRDIAPRAGERLTGIDVTMTRGSAITGIVTGGSGEPVEGVGVQLFRWDDAPGRTRSLASLPALTPTDDRGRFRLQMVAPGTYYVGAVAVGGRRAEGPVYFPGRVIITEALSVPVDAGLDVTSIDIPFSPSIGVRLHGTVLDPGGQPLSDGVVQLVGSDAVGSPVLPRSSEIDAGRFEFLNMPPGTYSLSARSPASGLVSITVRNGQVSRSDGAPTLFGQTVVAVGAASSTPVLIPTSAGSTLTGRIVLEGATNGVTPSSFRLASYPGGRVAGGIQGGSFAEIASDWSFQMRGLGEPAWFSFTGPAGWWLKSLLIGGVESADRIVPFGRPEASQQDAIAVFSRTASEISGSVSGPQGRMMNYVMVAFTVDPNGWFPQSRFVQVGRPNQAGQYSVALPPGEYWIAAVDSLGVLGEVTLSSVLPYAERIVVGDSQRMQKDLRYTALPR